MDLQVQAARYERKAVYGYKQLKKFQEFVDSAFAVSNENSNLGGRPYDVYSLYFDSPGLISYQQKINGESERFKFRIRTYDLSANECFVEIKKKELQKGQKIRQRLPVSILEATRYLSQNLADKTKIDPQFFCHVKKYNLRPTVWIYYQRTAYVSPVHASLRVTVDQNLQVAPYLPEGKLSPPRFRKFLPHQQIVEFKSGDWPPQWLEKLIEVNSQSKESFSKYCEGLDFQNRVSSIVS